MLKTCVSVLEHSLLFTPGVLPSGIGSSASPQKCCLCPGGCSQLFVGGHFFFSSIHVWGLRHWSSCVLKTKVCLLILLTFSWGITKRCSVHPPREVLQLCSGAVTQLSWLNSSLTAPVSQCNLSASSGENLSAVFFPSRADLRGYLALVRADVFQKHQTPQPWSLLSLSSISHSKRVLPALSSPVVPDVCSMKKDWQGPCEAEQPQRGDVAFLGGT